MDIDPTVFLEDPKMLGLDFLSVAQKALIKSIYGVPLTPKEKKFFGECCDTPLERKGYRETFAICGARSGKSLIAGALAVAECIFGGHDRYLTAGETGTFVVIAANKKQARIVFNYCLGMFQNSKTLSEMFVKNTAEEILLTNRTAISTWPCNRVSCRGLSIIGAALDEVAHWRWETDSPMQDVEVYRAVKRGMLQFPDSKLFAISTPYAKTGLLYDRYKDREDTPETLVWKASTWVMNTSVDRKEIDKAYKKDPAFADAEYGSNFRQSISSFFSSESIEACTVQGRRELPPVSGVTYRAALDAGFKADFFVFMIAHKEKDRIVFDVIRSYKGSRRYPVKLAMVCQEIKILKGRYHFSRITGDQYGAEILKAYFQEHSLSFDEKTFTSRSKATMYGKLKASLNSSSIELLDHRESLVELRALEIKLLAGGTMRISHPERGGFHDDHADCIALLTDSLATGCKPGVVVLDSDENKMSGLHKRAWNRFNYGLRAERRSQ
ncbi:hypothetical protein ACFLU6_05475 [Acidobacteriota bacterium]